MSEFLIMFREVLEGVLVVGILYTFIVKTGREQLKKSIINETLFLKKNKCQAPDIKYQRPKTAFARIFLCISFEPA